MNNAQVKYFAICADITGIAAETVPLPDGATVQDLVEAIYDRHEKLREFDSQLQVAVNWDYAERNDVLPVDAEVALIPPVSGGQLCSG